ncbi:cyclase family protein [Leptobacterium flavescens]|uniref:Cyclase family protein n=1 Tax=Leptobacterium flavescens TaxID=472055 RepID=A0A6P0UJR1_9FLAO|nr:cyclase family protein [Leptobacterium flavescens]NER13454.1 cyclase family protein [Leptobacterium flavescens]
MKLKTHTFVFVLIALISLTTVRAQTKDKGPWWPHPIWGAGDQAGASNWITPEKVLEATSLVKTGKVYELGQVYETGMPLFGARTYELRSPGAPTGGPFGENKLVYNDEFITTEIGQVGTQFDGLGHIGTRLKFDDGKERDVFYNGHTGDEIYSPYGLKQLGIENIKPIITRGYLIDIAGYKNVEALDHSYEVTLADVKGAMEKQGIKEADLKNGDALFFRYGWSKYWNNPDKYNTNPPGIGMEVARWLASKNVSMIGSDQYGTEVEPSSVPNAAFPVHQFLINQHGILNLENLTFDSLAEDRVYQFMFVFTPVPFKGATGSPGRPIAIR